MHNKARVIFHKCIINIQEYGVEDEYMVSRIFYSIETSDERYDNLTSDVKLTSGDSYETGSLEISRPENYKGPFNYSEFVNVADAYIRNLFGSRGREINISGSSNVHMSNITMIHPMEAYISIDSSSGGW